jgi:aquaporin Z
MKSEPQWKFRRRLPLYLFEAAELAIFMIAACFCTTLLFHASYASLRLIPNAALRRGLMGAAMGLTAVLIIRCPMGQRSGAHFNPAITLSYLRLGKIGSWDALFYVIFQFIGGVFGVALSAILLGKRLSAPSVDYAVTVPGRYGTTAAFCAELFMSALLMGIVLWVSNYPSIARYTSYVVGVLIAFYILFFAPVSGFSINPARTTGSAVIACVWTAVWVYFTAPLMGMMGAAEIFARVYGVDSVLCAKLHPGSKYLCPYICNFPHHRHDLEI